MRLRFAGVEHTTVPDPDVKRLMGRLVGKENEERVLRALRQWVGRIWWLQGASRASLRQDRAGIDVVVSTLDAGELHLQVKSSVAGARHHAERYGGTPIGLVLVQRRVDDATVAGRALGALIKLREEMGL